MRIKYRSDFLLLSISEGAENYTFTFYTKIRRKEQRGTRVRLLVVGDNWWKINIYESSSRKFPGRNSPVSPK